MVVSLDRGTLIYTPKHYSPDYSDYRDQKRCPHLGTPQMNVATTRWQSSCSPMKCRQMLAGRSGGLGVVEEFQAVLTFGHANVPASLIAIL